MYIDKQNDYLIIWQFVITFLVLVSSFTTPYVTCFSKKEKIESSFYILEDLGLCVDIVLNFFTNNENTFNFRLNFISYLKFWFIIDLITIFPFHIIPISNYKIKLLLRLPGLLLSSKLIQNRNVNCCLDRIAKYLKITLNMKSLIKLFFLFFYFNHVSACLFYFLARIQGLDPSTWVYNKGLLDINNAKIYIWALYWNLTTVTTVGYGNIRPFSWIEKIYTIIVISFGVVMYSFFIGTFSMLITTMKEKEIELTDKLNVLNEICLDYGISEETYKKIKKAIKYETFKSQIDVQIFIKELPSKLKISLLELMNNETITKFFWLRTNTKNFIGSVVPLLRFSVMFQNDAIYRNGEIVENSKNTKYFII